MVRLPGWLTLVGSVVGSACRGGSPPVGGVSWGLSSAPELSWPFLLTWSGGADRKRAPPKKEKESSSTLEKAPGGMGGAENSLSGARVVGGPSHTRPPLRPPPRGAPFAQRISPPHTPLRRSVNKRRTPPRILKNVKIDPVTTPNSTQSCTFASANHKNSNNENQVNPRTNPAHRRRPSSRRRCQNQSNRPLVGHRTEGAEIRCRTHTGRCRRLHGSLHVPVPRHHRPHGNINQPKFNAVERRDHLATNSPPNIN